MKYGLELQMFGSQGDPRTVGNLALLAERSGWDGVFLEDYLYSEDEKGTPVEVFDPWIELAVIAAKTDRVRIGTELTPISRRRPWKVAREAVTLDHLSNGRMTLTAGLGGFLDEMNDKSFTHFGEVVDARKRAKMLDEALEIIDGLWRGKPFSYHGKYYNIKEVTFLPTPVQKPRIPLWIGGFYPRPGPLKRAAKWDGFCPAGTEKLGKDGTRVQMTTADVISMKKSINELRVLEDAPFSIVLGGTRRSKDSEKERELRKQYLEADPDWWIEYIPQSFIGMKEANSIIDGGPIRVD